MHVLSNIALTYSTLRACTQGLWCCISSASSVLDGDGSTRSVTYEQRQLSEGDVAQLSQDFDIVIMAAGAGTNK